MSRPAIIKVNQLVYYLDCYLRDHKPAKDAPKLEQQQYEIALQSVDILKEMFAIPFPPGPGCKTPWYGGVVLPRFCKTPWYGHPYSIFCKTPWMGMGPIAASRRTARRAK